MMTLFVFSPKQTEPKSEEFIKEVILSGNGKGAREKSKTNERCVNAQISPAGKVAQPSWGLTGTPWALSENGLMRLVELCSWGVNPPALPACPAWQGEREHSRVEKPNHSIQLSGSRPNRYGPYTKGVCYR